LPFSRGNLELDTHSASQVWKAALGQLEVEIPRPNFETWLRNTAAQSVSDDVLVVTTPNAFTAEMLQKRLSATIERAVENVAHRPMEVRFTVKNNDSYGTWESSPNSSAVMDLDDDEPERPARAGKSRFRPELNFETFVAGTSNQLAHAAALQVAESPGAVFNPLYLYSSVGLGKTHLLHAIGNTLVRTGHSVLYVSAERFTNEYIRAIRDGATEEFRTRFRSVDALLIDDIQFITSKPQTQEGFFHTFNELHMAGKQIVVSGDLPAERINLEQRIQSRLSGGLVVDIQAPDYETRYAIVERKAKQRGCPLTTRVIEVLASAPVESVRDLEGGLNRVVAYAQLTRSEINVELAEKALESIGSKKPLKFPAPDVVIATVAAHSGVPEAAIVGPRRDRRTSSARRMAAYLLREESKLTASHAGNVLGGKDHSSILYAQKKFEEELASDLEVRKMTADVRNALRNGAQ
jgi:chromosomal replication initiator protein